jgi:hypothetical protein
MAYTIQGCTAADGAALARNNMSAFWTDPTWPLLWSIPLEEIISNCEKRVPWNLLRDRDSQRHTKAVDSHGNLVGYARWILPGSRKGQWVSAQAPDVSRAVKMEFMKSHAAAEWNPRSDMDVLDDPVHVKMRRIKSRREYICKRLCLQICSHCPTQLITDHGQHSTILPCTPTTRAKASQPFS